MGGCLSGLVDSQAAAVSTYPGLPQVVEINPKAYTARHACGNVQVNGSMCYVVKSFGMNKPKVAGFSP